MATSSQETKGSIDLSQSSNSNSNSSSDYSNFKPGQKYPTPSPGELYYGNGDRVFYETLLSQKPESEMAQEWCLYYGVLDVKQAQHLFDLIQSRKRKLATGSSPMKRSVPILTINNSSKDKETKKKGKNKGKSNQIK